MPRTKHRPPATRPEPVRVEPPAPVAAAARPLPVVAAGERVGRWEAWLPLVLVLIAWLYVWFQVEPPLRYHRAAPVFLLRTDFLVDHFRRPGGLIECAGAWLAQLDCHAPLGALANAALIGLVVVGVRRVFGRTGAPPPVWILVPALLLLVLAGQYDFPAAGIGLGLAMAIWAMAAWQAWRPARVTIRCVAFAVVSALLCHVAGLVPALVFVLSVGVWEVRTSPRRIVVACGLAALGGVGGVLLLAGASAEELRPRWGQGVPLVTGILLHLWLPGTVGWWRLRPAARRDGATGPASPRGGRVVPTSDCRRWKVTSWPWWAAGLVGSAGVLAFTFEFDRKAITQIERDVQEGRWERALDRARRLRTRANAATRLAINRALYQTGRLTTDLFAFPQQRGTDLLPSLRDGTRVCEPLSDTLLELGQVNLAEHFAHEALETLGERPHLLWQLARINVLLNRPRAARVFLNRLRQVPFHRARAERRLQAIAADPTLATEPDIARIRPWQVTSDQAESSLPTEFLLRQLLRSNRRNRMAFEYLLAHYLLTDQPDAVVGQLEVLGEFGFWQTPRHVEEAMLVHLAAKGGVEPEMGGRRVSADTVRRFQEFGARLSAPGHRVTGIETQLAREFGDTYWFYRLFGATFGGAPPAFTTARP